VACVVRVSVRQRELCAIASAFRQLAVLRYLVEELHCPWDIAAVREAAAVAGEAGEDNTEVLQWLDSFSE
jgi:hypothetical protein